MDHSETDSKLNTVNGVAHGAKRDMDGHHPDQEMQPTPVQPHLAHCCACNAAEIAASAERQRVSEQGGMDREVVSGETQKRLNLVAWASEIVSRNSPGNPCIEEATAYMSAVFKSETAKIGNASTLKMPTFLADGGRPTDVLS